MNRKILTLTVVLLASAGAVAAVANARGGDGEDGWRGGHFGRHGHHFREGGERGWHGGRGHHGKLMRLRRLDADNDGSVTLEEFIKPKNDRFAELDTNKDGFVDADELTARMKTKAEHRARMMMARMDFDGDGKIQKDDFRGKGRWGRWHDRDGMRDDDRGADRADAIEDADEPKEAEKAAEASGTSAAAQSPQAEEPAAKSDTSERWRDRKGRRGARRAQMFERMDANGDGVIDMTDLLARANERIDYAKRKRMHVLDKNGDGKISLDEFTARSRQRFADLDLDNDGKITAKDLPPRVAEFWEQGKQNR